MTKQIAQIGDFQFISVVAFHSAKTVLCEEFSQMANKNTMYIELPDQRSQVELFWFGNIEAVVMDIDIFGYVSQVRRVTNCVELVDIHEFPPLPCCNPYAALRETFNQRLERFKQQPAYFQLLENYSLFVR